MSNRAAKARWGEFKLGSVPIDAVEERRQLQRRLAAFFGLLAVLTASFMALGIITYALVGTFDVSRVPVWATESLVIVVGLSVWAYARRGERSTRALVSVDIAGSLLCSIAFAWMGWSVPVLLRPELFSLLFITQLLATRAVMVPSSAHRTLLIGSGAVVATVLFTYAFYLLHGTPKPQPTPIGYAGFAFAFGCPSVAITTITSAVLYGLRRKVRVARQLGQYTLETKLGEGGMGVVYRGHHALLRRPVAIKLLRPERTDADALARFEREVQLTSELTHPNTIAVYDYGRTQDGVFYYVMEYLDGFDLETLVELDGPQPPGRVVRILEQVAGALREAHERGLIHRDIKPSNIVLCDRGGEPDVVKVLDFGLARPQRPEADVARTSSNTFVGTPLYMAPEAIVGSPDLDAQSDVYAFGAVAYFLLTGRPVFTGTTLVEVCAKHLHEQPALPAQASGQPFASDLTALILACLAKTPEARPPGARALVQELSRCSDAGSFGEIEARRWWASRAPALRAERDAKRSLASRDGVLTVAWEQRAHDMQPASRF